MSRHDECCSDQCRSGLRNNYFEGKRITADSFKVEQKYLVDRRRLLNRAMHGWGVVYGYEIKIGEAARKDEAKDLSIGPGLALDKHGRELVQTGRHLDFKDVLVLADGRKPQSFESLEDGGKDGRWILSVHYAERSAALVKVNDPCECERDQWDHTCETVRFFLRRAGDDKQECCRDFDCELNCECAKGGCCGDVPRGEHPAVAQQAAPNRDPLGAAQQGNPHAPPPVPTKTHGRGGCGCLCDHITGLQPLDDDHALCDVEGCGVVKADLLHYVDLACISFVRDQSQKWTIDKLDACGPRRLVKSNDLLFDLIRGCDLTRISAIGWAGWHRRVEAVGFDEFRAAFRTKKSDRPDGPRFTVTFSRPVKRDTVRADCFAMTVMTTQSEGGWLETFRVPIVDVLPAGPEKPGIDTEYLIDAEIIVDDAWFEDAVLGRRSIFIKSETWVEFEVRGGFIVDCNGQTVDADARGLDKAPSGNGTPGGTFLSTFRVAPASEGPKRVRD